MPIPTLSPTEITARETLTALSQRRAIVEIGPEFDDDGVGHYAETGMRAHLTAFFYNERNEGWEIGLDFAPLEEHNRPLETVSFYGRNDTLVTARESGNYKPQCTWYIGDLSNWTKIISPVDGYTSVLSTLHQADPRGLSYMAWLETLVAEQLCLTA